MIYPIVKFGDPVLERPAEPVTVFDDELRKLIDDMFESMYEARGVGLAAPQIGISRRLAVIDITFKEDPDAKLVLANPEILHKEGKHTQPEGCLSIPGFSAVVERPKKVVLRGVDLDGKEIFIEGSDLLARAFCHEMDHLDGKFFLDHLSFIKRDMIKRRIKKLIRKGKWE